MTADRNLRQAVAELMVDVHLIPRELADVHVAEMDDIEIAQRFRMYTGLELSASERNQKSGSDFYQVFRSATATARREAFNPAPAISDRVEARISLPELVEKTWSDGGGGR